MARKMLCFLLVQSSIYKVLSIYAQPTIQQYLHLTGSPLSTHTITVPTTQHMVPPPNIPMTNQPRPATGLTSFSGLALPELVSRIQQLPASQQTALQNQLTKQTTPSTGLPSFSALGLPNLVSNLQQFPSPNYSEVKPATPSSNIDSNLLNNLAIALQLLIVSNILNSPLPTDFSVAKPKEIPACVDPIHSHGYPQTQIALPNSKFIGSSSFAEPNIAQGYRPTKTSMSLMSPYEALASSSYSDPILTQYTSANPRKDFQSPYSMIGDQDMFSMSDLF